MDHQEPAPGTPAWPGVGRGVAPDARAGSAPPPPAAGTPGPAPPPTSTATPVTTGLPAPPRGGPVAVRDTAPPPAPGPGRGGRRQPARGLRFARSREDRIVAGVCGGLARRLGVDAVLLRAAAVVLALAGGAGVVLYLVAWSLADDDAPTAARPVTTQQGVAVGMVLLGVLLLLRDAGLWLGDGVVLPVLLVAIGSVVLWARGGDADRARWAAMARRLPGDPVQALLGDTGAILRVVVGVLLLSVGITTLLATDGSLGTLAPVLAAVLLTLAGAGLAFGRWVGRLVGQLGEERAERIRSEERADVAAHLHDSVLQTLALIQRSVDEPRRAAALARSQERELRAWLYGRRGRADDVDATLRDLVEAGVAEVEAAHALDVEVVVVGDRPADGDVAALVAALREALVNVARHAGVTSADVYVEVEPRQVTAFVRDRGSGFDAAAVPDDRRGIADSVRSRLRRHGGSATLTTAPGEGTEWELVLPYRPGTPAAAGP